MSSSIRGLVALQVEGSGPAIYFVPGAGGSAERLAPLARLMGDGRPFYVFSVPGREGTEEPIANFEAVAKHFVVVLQSAQPRGPYLLAGYSWGGMVAYEMAQQLVRQGQTVALLAILDIAPLRADQRHLRKLIDWLGVTFRLSRWQQLRLFFRLRPILQSLRGRLPRTGVERGDERANPAAVVLGEAKGRPPGTPQPTRPLASEDVWAAEGSPNARVRKLVHLNERALLDYSPKPYPGRLVLFRSRAARPSSDTLGWDLFATQGVQEFVIPGRHLDILKVPAVEELANVLRACADEAAFGSDAGPSARPVPDEKAIAAAAEAWPEAGAPGTEGQGEVPYESKRT